MTLPTQPVVLPSDLKGQPNGTLDPSLLVQVHPSGRLHHTVARAWAALVDWSASQGIPLTFIYGGMYRTYDQQKSLFLRRYTTSFLDGRPRKWWQGQWWYQLPNTAMAAVPGTSNHGLGLAIDAGYDTNPGNGIGPNEARSIGEHPKFALWRDNVARFGFSFEVQSEPWHIRYVAGDVIPKAVTDFELRVLSHPGLPPFNPAAGQWGLWPIAPKPAAKLGDKGDHVKYLQGVLRVKCGQQVSVDGDFGTQTEKAVRNVQLFFQLAVDGWVGAQTWKTIDWLTTL